MKILHKIWFVLLFATFSSAYSGSCFEIPYDVADCKVRAEKGGATAQYNLGGMYDNGYYGVPQNYKEAAKWYLEAAKQGIDTAQLNIGNFYYQGLGVSQNYTEAMKWYLEAADQGIDLAQLNIGVMYHKGIGVPQNFTEALKWYRIAASKKNSDALYNLGIMYAKAEGVSKDYLQAHKWLTLAANQGNRLAEEYRDQIEVRMSSAQRTKIQKLISRWSPTK